MSEIHFFYGTLRHLPLLEVVLGRKVEGTPARLMGYRPHVAVQGDHPLSFPILVPAAEAEAEGILVSLDAQERARFDFYETSYRTGTLNVRTIEGHSVAARVALDGGPRWTPGPVWDFASWRDRWARISELAAHEFMALEGQIDADAARLRYPMILVRAASRLRAEAEPAPETLRRSARPGDVEIEELSTGYARFFAVEDYRIRHVRFTGARSPVVDRAVFISGDATVVLPYDPVRDRVLLIEQIRMGPLARGAANPWQIETVAGRVDPGETPEEAARREAIEEAGITLTDLLAAPRYYPSSGAKAEFLYCYVALADLPDGAGRPGGLEEEGEDIRPHLISFPELMALIDSGEVENGPLLVLALWLARERDRLRAQASMG